MINPLAVTSGGYLNCPLSVVSDGYLVCDTIVTEIEKEHGVYRRYEDPDSLKNLIEREDEEIMVIIAAFLEINQ